MSERAELLAFRLAMAVIDRWNCSAYAPSDKQAADMAAELLEELQKLDTR